MSDKPDLKVLTFEPRLPAPPEPDPVIVARLEEALERAKAGEIDGMCVSLRMKNGETWTSCCLAAHGSAIGLLGAVNWALVQAQKIVGDSP